MTDGAQAVHKGFSVRGAFADKAATSYRVALHGVVHLAVGEGVYGHGFLWVVFG